jgi:hypothetical protein
VAGQEKGRRGSVQLAGGQGLSNHGLARTTVSSHLGGLARAIHHPAAEASALGCVTSLSSPHTVAHSANQPAANLNFQPEIGRLVDPVRERVGMSRGQRTRVGGDLRGSLSSSDMPVASDRQRLILNDFIVWGKQRLAKRSWVQSTAYGFTRRQNDLCNMEYEVRYRHASTGRRVAATKVIAPGGW